MAAKSIVQVDIQDGAWKAFNRSVIKHQASLRQMPGQWGAVGSSIGKAANASAKFVATIAETSRQFKNANTAAGKMTLALKASDRVVSSLGRGTATVARNLKDATKSLLGWLPIMGIFSGLVGAGGLFGIARMAAGVSAGQVSAAQAGTTRGGEKAAQIEYGQVLGGEGGVSSLLKKMAEAQQKGGIMFERLGIHEWRGKDTAELLPRFLEAIQKIQKESPEGVKALVAEKMVPDIDYNTILGLSTQNLDLLEKEMKARRRALELSTPTQNAWSNFNRQLDFAGEKIENSFIRGLTPLLPALTKFSDALIKAVSTILDNPATKRFIEGLGASLESFAKYLTGGDFSKDFDSFMQNLKKIGEAFVSVAEFINKWIGKSTPEEAKRPHVTAKEAAAYAAVENRSREGMSHTTINNMSGGLGKSFSTRVDVYVHQSQSSDTAVRAHAVAVPIGGR